MTSKVCLYTCNTYSTVFAVCVTPYKDVSFICFYRYLYNDVETVQSDIVTEVVKIAHLYQVTPLVESCCNDLSKTLTTENACSLLEMAMLYERSALKERIIDFIDKHAEK